LAVVSFELVEMEEKFAALWNWLVGLDVGVLELG
jgi:hypothetical protein